MGRRALLLLAFVGVVLLGAVLLNRLTQAQGSVASEYVTATVSRHTLEENIVARGRVGFGPTMDLVAATTGRVTSVAVAAGDIVQPGSTLLKIDGRPMVAARGDFAFWRPLSPGMSGSDVSQLQTIIGASKDTGAKPGVFDRVTSSLLEAWQATHGFDAPDGNMGLNDFVIDLWPRRIDDVPVTPGVYVAPGTVVVRTSGRVPVVEVHVTPGDRLRLAVGAAVRVDGGSADPGLTGWVDTVALNPTRQSDGSETYVVGVALPPDQTLPAGIDVRVTILVRRAENVLAVPLAAVVAGDDGRPAVRALSPSGVELVSIDLGFSAGAYVEVRAGLMGGEVVIVAGP